jgi:hypothetical protein
MLNLALMATKKKAAKKTTKKRPDKYQEKLKLNGTFDQLLGELINPKNPIKKK